MMRVTPALVALRKKLRDIRSLATAASLLALAFPQNPASAQSAWPAGLKAEYEVGYNGFNVGSFVFKAESEQQSYTLSGSANLSMLLGMISWSSDIRSFGSLAQQAPKPAVYSFDARSGSRAASTRVSFEAGSVATVAHSPQMPSKPDVVPLREQHLKGVVDPLSAMMMVTQGAAPCDRRIPIFDGYERFDLVLSRKGEMRLSEQQAGGAPVIAQVCQVRYVPIAGHIPDGDTKFMASNSGIEVVMRPVPGAKIYVPYQITIPMPLGSATLVSKRVEVMQGGRKTALLH